MSDDFTQLVDLASERLGGEVIAANDEFFAPKENLLKAGKAVFIEDKFTDRGKWMDGWETRRRRAPGVRPHPQRLRGGAGTDPHLPVGNLAASRWTCRRPRAASPLPRWDNSPLA